MSGTTAICTLFVKGTVYVANVGDSRTVLCTDGKASWATHDHKPDDPKEHQRITALGGLIDYGGIVSPDGSNFLKCARSLGDVRYKGGPREKHLICAEPEVFTRGLAPADELLIMGSDGVWDVISDQKACDIVMKSLAENPGKPHLAAKALCLGAYQAESEDNICATVLLLSRRPSKTVR